jgi:hypothetical protein
VIFVRKLIDLVDFDSLWGVFINDVTENMKKWKVLYGATIDI